MTSDEGDRWCSTHVLHISPNYSKINNFESVTQGRKIDI